MRWAFRLVAGLTTLLGVAGLVGVWAWVQTRQPGPLAEERVVVIPRGSGLVQISRQLAEAGVVTNPWLLMVAGTVVRSGAELRAGEYAFAAGIPVLGVLEQLRRGRTVMHKLTVAEGLTVAQVVALLRAEPALSGELAEAPAEGSLLPDTYHFALGDSRAGLVQRMQTAMSAALAEHWTVRSAAVSLQRPEQAIVLASIVEKETGVAGERARIAGVFYNRLAHGMKLQSDPTVIYGLSGGQGALGRPLTQADWRSDTPFNTYQIEGLPPAPIANPGRAALKATLNPEKHEYLYFVADGSGGHAFAKTLADHNHNVAHWRQVQKAAGQSNSAGD
jgi:UPF0755 protein